MADEDRFSGLRSALNDEDNEDVDPDKETTEMKNKDPKQETSGKQTLGDKPNQDQADGGFPFEDTVQKSVYVRKESFERVEDLEPEVDLQLRREHGVRDLTRREFYDAIFRVASNHPEEIIEAILEVRDYD